MLKKTIIVSENVGAKYMVIEGENGYVVETENSDKLKEALEKMILNSHNLEKMGEISRSQYEKLASFDMYKKELQKLIDKCR